MRIRLPHRIKLALLRSPTPIPLLLYKAAYSLAAGKACRPVLTRGYCPLCNARTRLIKFQPGEWEVHCTRCGATPPIMSLVGVAREVITATFRAMTIYEMSSYGPLHRFFSRQGGNYHFSEHFEGVAPGGSKRGVPCQDVQNLTYGDETFDLVTCTEVFEHVPDDRKGFDEVCRTLQPGGWFIFTVPLHRQPTVERAVHQNGTITHLLPPTYHADPLSAQQCLCYRDYGPDIVRRLRKSGFAAAGIRRGRDYSGWGYARHVIVACKGVSAREAANRLTP